MCSAVPRGTSHITADDVQRIARDGQELARDRIAEIDRRSRVVQEHAEAMRANQRGLWIGTALLVAIVLKLLGLLP